MARAFDIESLDATFGAVVTGMDVVDQIKVGDHMKKITLSDKPAWFEFPPAFTILKYLIGGRSSAGSDVKA